MNSTVKAIAIVVAIALLGLLAGLGIRFLGKNKQVNNQKPSKARPANNLELPDSGAEFAWGITVLTFPFRTYQEPFTGVQMAEAKQLGVNYVRVDYLPTNPKAAEVAVEAARANGLKVVLVIPFGPKDIFTDKALANNTESYVSAIVKRFKGKVAVYQLATEVASVALANNAAAHGIEKKDYPADKLAAVTTWVKTAATTVASVDPSAKRLVNDQWVHVGFFDHYFAAGGNFDLLGWNWFSDMGTNMETVVIDKAKNQKYQLLSKLKSYNKPIWLTEVNRRLGSQGGQERAQADFIKTMANYAARQNAINGFFVFNLLEDQAAPEKERGYSIITATDTGKEQKITGRKPAFEGYRKAIQNNR